MQIWSFYCVSLFKAAVRWCIVCDDPFCALHWDDLHRRGARSMHPFCAIDLSGSIDNEALNSQGVKQGRFDGVGPQSQGGGDDGLGNMSVVEEEGEDNSEGSAVKEGGGEEWAVFTDEQGAAYWYNNVTSETTYDDPKAGAGNEVAVAEWSEFSDDDGNPYWHNNATGDSTYDSPFA